ncbi:MAG TPA: hypothetical protein P5144_10450 [Thermoanaerobaculia bacterium]|nr:hypothetical protein [Thermoanaerobaculia bacterium]
MLIVSGTYVGNNANNRAITGVGFRPRLLFIRRQGSTDFWWKSTAHATNAYNIVWGTGQQITQTSGINTIDADGFTVSAGVNATGSTYRYICFEPDDAVLQVGQYTGTGGSRNITCATGFVPTYVALCRNETGTQSNGHWSNPTGGNLTGFPGFTITWLSGYITGTHADGFSVGSAMNVNGLTHNWFAFRSKAGNVFVGTFTGNSTDNRNIVMGDAFQPTELLCTSRATSNNAGRNPTWRDPSHVGDQSVSAYWGDNAADLIQSFRADGFQVGIANFDMNTTGYTYTYIAFISQATATPISRKFWLDVMWDGPVGRKVALGFDASGAIGRRYRVPFSFEALVPLARAFLLVFDSARGTGRGYTLPFESAGDAVLFRRFPIPVETVVALGRALNLPVEASEGILARAFLLPVEAGMGIGRAYRLPAEWSGDLTVLRKFWIPLETRQRLARTLGLPVEAAGQTDSLSDVWRVYRKLSELFGDEWRVIPVGVALEFLETWDVKSAMGMELIDTWRVLPPQLLTLWSGDIQLPSATMEKQ